LPKALGSPGRQAAPNCRTARSSGRQQVFLQEFGLAHAPLGKEALRGDEPDVEDLQVLLRKLRSRIVSGVFKRKFVHELSNVLSIKESYILKITLENLSD
jgi:hypothetical protein